MAVFTHYFAFGSNMSRVRLEARIGRVEDLGRAWVEGYAHHFSKLGADGTGKGNIEPEDGAIVHGVLYRLTSAQLGHLEGFEGGYRRAPIEVVHSVGAAMVADTFVALRPRRPLPPPPSTAYLEHYLTGLREHGIPETYVELLLAAAGG